LRLRGKHCIRAGHENIFSPSSPMRPRTVLAALELSHTPAISRLRGTRCKPSAGGRRFVARAAAGARFHLAAPRGTSRRPGKAPGIQPGWRCPERLRTEVRCFRPALLAPLRIQIDPNGCKTRQASHPLRAEGRPAPVDPSQAGAYTITRSADTRRTSTSPERLADGAIEFDVAVECTTLAPRQLPRQ
jgi:hypothetical protein